ncbi:MAG TPA: cytochrome c [Candidatus Limnocylindrales bacterium]|nr:cytochrome c [Candidatus Limnocylindrales bacterium]
MPPETSNRRIFIYVALAVIMIAATAAIVYSITGWSVPSSAKKLQNPVPPTESAVSAGMFNYSKHCKSCHGDDGNGQGDRAGELSVKPSDFTNAAEMNRLTDGELFWKITHGKRPMPAFEDKLSDTERWQVVDYVRTFAKPQPAK